MCQIYIVCVWWSREESGYRTHGGEGKLAFQLTAASSLLWNEKRDNGWLLKEVAALASVLGLRLTYLHGMDRGIRLIFKCKEKWYILVSQSQMTASIMIRRNTFLFWGREGRWYFPQQIVLKTLTGKPKALSANSLSFVPYQIPSLIGGDLWELSFWTICKMCTAALFFVHINAQCWVMSTAGVSWYLVQVLIPFLLPAQSY